MSSGEGYSLAADGALESLVSQFSDRLACFRELVQNAIDAGSRRVDVWLEHLPGEGGLGTSAVHVRDDGEGMTAEIIDGQLTRLFASSKEGDRGKIGKFGIGFVSIFALGPRAVLLHTGRQAEAWEVVFHADRSFTRSPLPTAFEGTHVCLYLETDLLGHAELARGARAALWRWCRFAEIDLRFQDRAAGPGEPERIQAAFELEGDCGVHLVRSDLEMCLAYQPQPTYGFYNRGLTLLESTDAQEILGAHAPDFHQVGFRVRADVLEHTLSRETILRDEQLDRVLAELRRAARGPLLDRLVAELEGLAAEPEPGPAVLGRASRLTGLLSGADPRLLPGHQDRKLLRTLGSGPRSLADAWDAAQEGLLVVCPEGSAVVDALRAEGGFCLQEAPSGTAMAPVRTLVSRYLLERERQSVLGRVSAFLHLDLRAEAGRPETWLGYRPAERLLARLQDPHDVFLAVEPLEPPPDAEAMLQAAAAMLQRAGLGCPRLSTCRVLAPGQEPPLFVHGPRMARLMRRSAPEGVSGLPACSALNLDHPQARLLLRLRARSPRLSAYALARALSLSCARSDPPEALLAQARDPQWDRQA